MPSRRGWTWVQRRGQELEESRVVMVVEDLIQKSRGDSWGGLSPRGCGHYGQR